LAEGIREMGGDARVEGDALVVAGGGLDGGGTVATGSDHRIAMAFAVAALGSKKPTRIVDMTSAEISFPGFVRTMRSLGARMEYA
jgi:3-phosphoshikimate 1-carboxyvinyltransferase